MTEEFAFVSASTTEEWSRWISRNINLSEGSGTLAQTTTLVSSPLEFPAADFDVNSSGTLLVLCPLGTVSVYQPAESELKSLTLIGYDDLEMDRPDAIASTNREIYLFDTDSDNLAVFSRQTRQLISRIDLSVDPITVVGSQRRVYVLEPATESGNGAVRTIESDGTTQTILDGLDSPVDLSVGPDETVYVLEDHSDGPRLVHSTPDVGTFPETPSKTYLEALEWVTPRYVSVKSEDTLVFLGTDEDDTQQFIEWNSQTDDTDVFDAPDSPLTGLQCEPTQREGGERPIYAHSGPETTLWELSERSVNKKDSESLRYEGRLINRFNSGRSDMQWHRTKLDLSELQPDTRVEFNYYTSDGDGELDDLSGLDCTQTQLDTLRAADIYGLWDLIEHTPAEVASLLPQTSQQTVKEWMDRAKERIQRDFEERSVQTAHDPEDILLTDAIGQYLHVEIRLVGNRESSPRLNSFKTYCPRKSYIRYLPEIYSKTQDQSAFLTRFLAIFESVFVDIEERLEHQTTYLDPEEIPVEYLSWLNEWLAVDLGDRWPEQARRELLARAPELYRNRGTKTGLMELLQLYLDHVDTVSQSNHRTLVQIERRLETLVDAGYLTTREATADLTQYRNRFTNSESNKIYFFEYDSLEWLSDEHYDQYYNKLIGHPRRFQILVQPGVPDKYVTIIENIIEAEKPVSADAEVKKLEHRFQLGAHTYLGINTVYPAREVKLGESTLGKQAILRPDERTVE